MSFAVGNKFELVSSAYKFPGAEYALMAFDYTIFAIYDKNRFLLELRFAWPDACRISQFISELEMRNIISLDWWVSSVEEECLQKHRQYHYQLGRAKCVYSTPLQIDGSAVVPSKGRRITTW